jgi:hypothetical protein
MLATPVEKVVLYHFDWLRHTQIHPNNCLITCENGSKSLASIVLAQYTKAVGMVVVQQSN